MAGRRRRNHGSGDRTQLGVGGRPARPAPEPCSRPESDRLPRPPTRRTWPRRRPGRESSSSCPHGVGGTDPVALSRRCLRRRSRRRCPPTNPTPDGSTADTPAPVCWSRSQRHVADREIRIRRAGVPTVRIAAPTGIGRRAPPSPRPMTTDPIGRRSAAGAPPAVRIRRRRPPPIPSQPRHRRRSRKHPTTSEIRDSPPPPRARLEATGEGRSAFQDRIHRRTINLVSG